MKNVEIEFRFKIEDDDKLTDFIKGLRFVSKKEQRDIYFDTPKGDMFLRGIYIRNRNNVSLDFKFNLEDFENKHEHCNEFSFSLPLSENDLDYINNVCKTLGLKTLEVPDLNAFLEANNLGEFVVINKLRQRFKDNEFNFCVDDVRGLGKFLEVESMASKKDDLEALKKKMMERVSAFNPKFIPVGYIEFFVRQKDFNLYKRGRFLLEEDR